MNWSSQRNRILDGLWILPRFVAGKVRSLCSNRENCFGGDAHLRYHKFKPNLPTSPHFGRRDNRQELLIAA